MNGKGNIHEEGMTFGSRPSKSKREEWVEEDFGNIDLQIQASRPSEAKDVEVHDANPEKGDDGEENAG